jgi:hypothetical protein
MNRFASSVLLLCLAGCVPNLKSGHPQRALPPQARTELVPLCPAIAEISYPKEKIEGKLINYFALNEAEKLRVKIRPLSSYTAMLQGSSYSVASFLNEYKFMICAFNPKLEINDKSTYLSCMHHAQAWVDIVRSRQPEKLMLTETLFRENCTPRISGQ